MFEILRRYQTWIQAGLLAVLGLAAFWPAVSFDFVNWDDPVYIQNNELIRSWSPENLKGIATEVVAKNYAPLTSLSFLVDYSVWRLNPCGYHVTNLLLHAINGVLVYLLICQLSGSRFVGFFTAALFLVHPVQIESVAWISSRKGLLCSLFMLWACIVRLRPESGRREDAWYYSLLALALLCKAHAIVLPAIVLLYDRLIRRTPWSTAVPRQFIPGLMSLGLLLTTMGAQNSMIGGVREHMELGLPQIIAVDVTILWKYFGMLILPTNLSVMYDPPTTGIWKQVLAGSLGFAVVGFFVWRKRNSQPLWILGAASIFLLLFPMLNFFRITTLMNDRYLYLPCIIVFAMAMSLLNQLLSFSASVANPLLDGFANTVKGSLATAAIVACLTLTGKHLPVWSNSMSLWTQAMSVSPDLPVVRIQMALTVHASGRVREAIQQMTLALYSTQPDELDRTRMRQFIDDWNSSIAARKESRTATKPNFDEAIPVSVGEAVAEPTSGEISPASGELSDTASEPVDLPLPFLSSTETRSHQ